VAALGASAMPWFIAGLFVLHLAPVAGAIFVGCAGAWWAYLVLSWLLERENVLDNRDVKPSTNIDPNETLVEGIPPATTSPTHSIFQN
jgi:hypothetical protein